MNSVLLVLSGEEVGISSIKAGDGVTATTTITVTTSSAVTGLDVDTPFRISDVATGYNGKFVVSEKVSDTQIKYQVQNAPTNALPNVAGSKLALSSDTVTSQSPYIFNISLRSVFGMCGMEADGSKAHLDSVPWLLHSLLVLDYRKMIEHL